MIYKKHHTYPTRRKIIHCEYIICYKLMHCVFFYVLLMKTEEVHSQSINNSHENTNFTNSPNSIHDFTISENLSHATPDIPAIKEDATKTAPFINTDSNITISKSLVSFPKSVSNADNLELAKIEPSDYNNMINVQSLDIDKSSDSFIRPRIKNTKWPSGTNTGSKYQNTNSTESFCNKNISQISFDGNLDKINQKESSTIDPVNKKTSHANSTTANNDQKSTTANIEVGTIPNSDDLYGKNTSAMRPNGETDKDGDFLFAKEKEFEEAEKMTKCIPNDFNKSSIVCVCNKTYCDKMLPLRAGALPSGKFAWYKSSDYDRYRFHRVDGQHHHFVNHVKDARVISTGRKLQTFIGFGGAFSDSASKNIESLSKETRKHLMQSYYGPFGLQYVLGRVPIGGTGFSPRYYTYMDIPKKFMLSEQDLKYKIPVIQEAIEIIHNNLKLVGCSWTAPKWMKTKCSYYTGELKYEYFQLYADYHVMFLDHYAKHGIKFWALSSGNKPILQFNQTEPPFVNAMEWSPYMQSKWVNRYLTPTLKKSGYQRVQLIIGDDNRDVIAFYLKWFFEPLFNETYTNMEIFLANEAFNDVSGISIHGYGDTSENQVFLDNNLGNLYYPKKFFLLGETACTGKPQLGAWDCAEHYAMQMMNYFYRMTSGFIDWNLALDQEGGPNYLNNFLDAAIIVNIEKDEFYKQPMYYVIGHFSKFLTPGSVRISLEPFNSTTTGVSAIAARRPDDGIVIVAYNRSPKTQKIVFEIDETYTLSINTPAKSINTVIFWIDSD